MISKSDYIAFRECRKNAWIKIHRPDIFHSVEVSEFDQALSESGDEVEAVARLMFPGGVLVEGRGAEAQAQSRALIDAKAPVIFQAAVVCGDYFAACDVLTWNAEAGAYDLFEVKMSSVDEDGKEKKRDLERFECDLTFQTIVLRDAGIPLARSHLVRLNRNYVRRGDLDVHSLFVIEDKSDRIAELSDKVREEMAAASQYLSRPDEPAGHCDCFYKSRNNHCTTFAHSNPHVPAYSVHDLARIGQKKGRLEALLEAGVLELSDVAEDADLTDAQHNQVRAHKRNEPLVDLDAIAAELARIEYPIYFLDYETSPAPIPRYDGHRPYEHVVFQYSLHVLPEPGAEPLHRELLVLDGDPSERIAEGLRGDIGDTGTIVSWYKTFENSRNKDLANLVPAHRDFLMKLVDRTYDLMDIVAKQHFVHPAFQGSASIKKVLPVLAPELSYDGKHVASGTDAIEAYRKIEAGEVTGHERETLAQHMRDYCKLDTYAMYVIWKWFVDLTSQSRGIAGDAMRA